MAGSLGQRIGKILAVLHFVRKFEDAARVDLLRLGTTLETCTIGWNDMFALFTASPPHTAIHYARCEKWDLKDHLLATSLDRLNVLLWTKTKDAHKKPPRNMPKRIPRPGVDERSQAPHMKDTVRDITEFMRMQQESGRIQQMYDRKE